MPILVPVKTVLMIIIIHGKQEAINIIPKGTKAAYNYELSIAPGKSKSIRLRLSSKFYPDPLKDFNAIFAERENDANEFLWRDAVGN